MSFKNGSLVKMAITPDLQSGVTGSKPVCIHNIIMFRSSSWFRTLPFHGRDHGFESRTEYEPSFCGLLLDDGFRREIKPITLNGLYNITTPFNSFGDRKRRSFLHKRVFDLRNKLIKLVGNKRELLAPFPK